MKASVVICTYNREQLIEASILAVQRQDFSQEFYEILVVDNNSTDRTKEIVHRLIPPSPVSIRYIFEENQGLSFARNAGINNAKGEVVVFTDDDIDAEPNWLKDIVAAFDDPQVACAGGPIRPIWPFPKPEWLTERWQGPLTISEFKPAKDAGEFKGPYYPWGANIAFRKDVFQTTGMFPTDLGRIGNCLLSNEEINLCRKIEESGKRIKFAPNAIIHHKIAPERIRKIWLHHRTYWQGRSCAVLDINTGRNIYSQLRANTIKLQNLAKGNSDTFERRCISKEIFGYFHQLIEGTPNEGRVSVLRRMRALKVVLNLLSDTTSANKASISLQKPATSPDHIAEIEALKEAIRVKDAEIEAFRNSLSWRITSPLRSLYDLLRKLG